MYWVLLLSIRSPTGPVMQRSQLSWVSDIHSNFWSKSCSSLQPNGCWKHRVEAEGTQALSVFGKEQEVRVPVLWKNRSLFVFCYAWCSWEETGAASATGQWSSEWSHSCHWSLKYLPLSTSYTYTSLGTAEIQLSLHSYGQSFKTETKGFG